MLDVHSFPPDYHWGAQEEKEEVVLLVDDPEHSFVIQEFLKLSSLKAAGNDIQDEAHELGASSILVEVKEAIALSALKTLGKRWATFFRYVKV